MRASASHKMRRIPTSPAAPGGSSPVWKFGPPSVSPSGAAVGWAPLTSAASSHTTTTNMSHLSTSSLHGASSQSRRATNKGSTINFGELTPASIMLNRRRGQGVVSRHDLRAKKKKYNFLTSERLHGQINRSPETTSFGSGSHYFKENNEGNKVHRRVNTWYQSRYINRSKLFPRHLAARVFSPSVNIRSSWGNAAVLSRKGHFPSMLRSELYLSKDLMMQAARGMIAKFAALPEVVDARKNVTAEVIAVAEESLQHAKAGSRSAIKEQVEVVKKLYEPLESIDLRKHLFRDDSVSMMLGGFQRYVLDYEFCLNEAIEVTQGVINALTVKHRTASSPSAKASFKIALDMATDLISAHKAKLAYHSDPSSSGGMTNKVVPEELLTLLVPSCIYVAPFSLLRAADRVLSNDPLGMVRQVDSIVDRDLVVAQQQFLLMRVAEARVAAAPKEAPGASTSSADAVPVIVSDALRLYLEHSKKTTKKSSPSERALNEKVLKAEIRSLRGDEYLSDCEILAKTMAAAVAFRHHPVLPDSHSLLPDKDRRYRKLILDRSLLSYTKMNPKTGQAYIRTPTYKAAKDFNTISEFLENTFYVKGTSLLARATNMAVGDGDSTASVPAFVQARDGAFLRGVFNEDTDPSSVSPRRVKHPLFCPRRSSPENKAHMERLLVYEPQYLFFKSLASTLEETNTIASTVSYVEQNAGALATALSAEVRYLATLRLNFLGLPDTRTLLHPKIMYDHHARATRERMTGIEFDVTTLNVASLVKSARKLYSLRGNDFSKSQLPMRPSALMELMLSRQRIALRKKIVNGIATNDEKELYDTLIDIPEFADLGPMHRGAFTLPFCERLALGEGRKTYRNPFSNYVNYRFGQIREAISEARDKGYLEKRGAIGVPGVGVLTRGIAAEWLQLPQEEKNKFDFSLRQHAFSGAANAESLRKSVHRPGGLRDDTNHAQFPLINPNISTDDALYDFDESNKTDKTRSKRAELRLEYEDYLRTGGSTSIAKRGDAINTRTHPSASALAEKVNSTFVLRRFARMYLHDPHTDAFSPTAAVELNGGGGGDVAAGKESEEDFLPDDATVFNSLARRVSVSITESSYNFDTPSYLVAAEKKKDDALKLLTKSTLPYECGLRVPNFVIQLLSDVESQTAPFYQKVAARNEGVLLSSKVNTNHVSKTTADDDEEEESVNHVFNSLIETLASAATVNNISKLSADTRYSLKMFTPFTARSTAAVHSIRNTIEPHLQNMIDSEGIRAAPKRFVRKGDLEARAKKIAAVFKKNLKFLFPKAVLKKIPQTYVKGDRVKVTSRDGCVGDFRTFDEVVTEEPMVPALFSSTAAHCVSADLHGACIGPMLKHPVAAPASPVACLFRPGSATSSLTGMAVFASVAHKATFDLGVSTFNWTAPGVRSLQLSWPNAVHSYSSKSYKSLVGISLPPSRAFSNSSMCSVVVLKPRSASLIPMTVWASTALPAEDNEARALNSVANNAANVKDSDLVKRVASAIQGKDLIDDYCFPSFGEVTRSPNAVKSAINALVTDPCLRPMVSSVPLITESERQAAEGTGRRFVDFTINGKWAPSSGEKGGVQQNADPVRAPNTVEKAFTSARRRVEAMLYFPDPLVKAASTLQAPPSIPKAAMLAALTNKKLLAEYWPSDALVISSKAVSAKASALPSIIYLADQAVCKTAHTEASSCRRLTHALLTNTKELEYPSQDAVSRATDVMAKYIKSKGVPATLPSAQFPLLHANSLVSSDFDDRDHIREIRSNYVFPEMSEEMGQAIIQQRAAERAVKEQENFNLVMKAMSAVASDSEAQSALEALDAPLDAEEELTESFTNSEEQSEDDDE